ncbi:MAG: cyclic nucleotide-binding domain-containing protein [Gammaproteobacteria bacterium]|nr:cyclic nucleotide-binding domain-containing protein [Gammaproteobacteria bacterium]
MPDIIETIPDLFERVLMLKRSAVFSEVNTDTLRIVARELLEETYIPGERVCDIDDQGDQMYIIESGKIGISINPDPAIKDFLAILEAGECFGEMGMLDDLPRSATAHVIEKSHLLVLEKACLRALISRFPELALGILRSMSLRLREANKLIKS